MVDFLSTSNHDKDEALRSILLTNHPIFVRLATLVKASYRVYFTNHNEMVKWLESRGWELGEKEMYSKDSVEEWYKENFGWIEFKKQFFYENGGLKTYAASDWNDEWIKFVAPAKQEESTDSTSSQPPRRVRSAAVAAPANDDIPF